MGRGSTRRIPDDLDSMTLAVQGFLHCIGERSECPSVLTRQGGMDTHQNDVTPPLLKRQRRNGACPFFGERVGECAEEALRRDRWHHGANCFVWVGALPEAKVPNLGLRSLEQPCR